MHTILCEYGFEAVLGKRRGHGKASAHVIDARDQVDFWQFARAIAKYRGYTPAQRDALTDFRRMLAALTDGLTNKGSWYDETNTPALDSPVNIPTAEDIRIAKSGIIERSDWGTHSSLRRYAQALQAFLSRSDEIIVEPKNDGEIFDITFALLNNKPLPKQKAR
jgi:hypothetical protein